MIAQQVDCIILNVPLSKDDAVVLAEKFPSLHLIFIDVPDGTPVHFVHGEHAVGASEVIKHLVDTGRTQFLLVAGPEASTAANIRLQSWLAEIADSGTKAVDCYRGDWQAHSGYLAISEAIGKQTEF